MPYLIYGEDTFRSRQKLTAIKEKYVNASLGDTNLAVLDGGPAKSEEIIRQIWAMPFLAAKRLVVIENLLTQGTKDIQESIKNYLPKIPSTSVVIFYEAGVPDKRGALFKQLNQPKQAEEFSPLEGPLLQNWIRRRLAQLGATAEASVINQLALIIGPDLWRMDQEISKLINYCHSSLNSPQPSTINPQPLVITIQVITDLIHRDPTGDIFQCLDALAKRDAPTALRHLRARISLGDSPLYLLSMIVYGFRTLLIIQDRLEHQPSATSAPGIHPYVWRKSAQQIKLFTHSSLRSIYRFLLDVDYAAKTGIIEPAVALDLFVFELCHGVLQEGKNEYLAARQRAS